MAAARNNGAYVYSVTARPVTKISCNDGISNSATNQDSLLIKVKFKAYIYNMSSNNNSSNRNPRIRNKTRTRKIKASYPVSWQDLMVDDGSPNSNSWTRISEIINYILPYVHPLSTGNHTDTSIYWVDHQNPTVSIALESRDELIRRVLEAARSMAPEQNSPCSNGISQLDLCIRKEIHVNHDGYVTRVQQDIEELTWDAIFRCAIRVQPPLETTTVKSELIECFQEIGVTRNELSESRLNRLASWLIMLFSDNTSTAPIDLTPAAEEVISSLPNSILDDSEDQVVCSVCLETMNAGAVVTQLPCSHVYHPACVMHWLHRCNHCPLCRFALPTES